jgi:hypothetical protein
METNETKADMWTRAASDAREHARQLKAGETTTGNFSAWQEENEKASPLRCALRGIMEAHYRCLGVEVDDEEGEKAVRALERERSHVIYAAEEALRAHVGPVGAALLDIIVAARSSRSPWDRYDGDPLHDVLEYPHIARASTGNER